MANKALVTATLVAAQLEAHNITFRAGTNSFPRNCSASRIMFREAITIFTAAALLKLDMPDAALATLESLDDGELVINAINQHAKKLKESQDSFTDVPWHTPKPAPWED